MALPQPQREVADPSAGDADMPAGFCLHRS